MLPFVGTIRPSMTSDLGVDDVIIIILSHLPPFPSDDVVVDTLTTNLVCTTPTTRVVPSSLSWLLSSTLGDERRVDPPFSLARSRPPMRK
jgi:hypothetical protein